MKPAPAIASVERPVQQEVQALSSPAPARTAEAMSRAIYAHAGFTKQAALNAFAGVKRKPR